MANYKEMYKKMFISASHAIELLQKAQQEAEELYVQASSEKPVLIDKHLKDKRVDDFE